MFYRVAVGVLHLPPLREREGDLSLLTDSLISSLTMSDSILKHKKKKFILTQKYYPSTPLAKCTWLQSTLLRAALWCQGETITAEDIRQALFEMPEKIKI